MKKIILLAAAVLMAASASFAQFNLGGRAAINFGTVWGDNTEDVPWGFGFNVGLATKIGINDMFAVAPEVTIDLRRSSDAVITWSTWAIDIPVLARINLMPALYLEVGPQFAIICASFVELVIFCGWASAKAATIPKNMGTLASISAILFPLISAIRMLLINSPFS